MAAEVAARATRADELDPWVERSYLEPVVGLSTLIPPTAAGEEARLWEEVEAAERELLAYIELTRAARLTLPRSRASSRARRSWVARAQLEELHGGMQLVAVMRP